MTPRAQALHAGDAALNKQMRDVSRATGALRQENEKLERLARGAARDIKMLGNVQNWAEVLERDFLVLEETVRLVKEGGSGGCGSECCSCSEGADSEDEGEGSGREEEEEDGGKKKGGVDLEEMARKLAALNFGPPPVPAAHPVLGNEVNNGSEVDVDRSLDKGKEPLVVHAPPDKPEAQVTVLQEPAQTTDTRSGTSRASLSESSTSVLGTESPCGTDGAARESETTSLSTTTTI